MSNEMKWILTFVIVGLAYFAFVKFGIPAVSKAFSNAMNSYISSIF